MEQTVNQRFKVLRTYLGLNQREIADALKLKQATVSAIEVEKQSVTPQTIEALAKLYNVSKYWLIEGKGEMLLGDVHQIETPPDWKEEAYSALKSERDLLKNELNRVWAIVQHLTNGSKPDFLKAIKEAGLLKYSLPGAQKRGSLIASA